MLLYTELFAFHKEVRTQNDAISGAVCGIPIPSQIYGKRESNNKQMHQEQRR